MAQTSTEYHYLGCYSFDYLFIMLFKIMSYKHSSENEQCLIYYSKENFNAFSFGMKNRTESELFSF